MKFPMKVGDTSPSLQLALGVPANLNGGTVTFSMAHRQTKALKVDSAGAVAAGTTMNPVVYYDWQASDTDEPGEFIAEFRVQYSDGLVETFPNDGYILVSIGEAL